MGEGPGVPPGWRCQSCGLDFSAEEPRCPQCLKQSTVVCVPVAGAPAARRAHSAAERHLEVNAIFQTLLVVGHVLFTLSAAMNLWLTLSGVGEAGSPLPGLYPAHQDGLERTTALVTFGWIGLWSALGIVWTPVNAWGLWRRRPWARASTIAYYVATLVGCCCLPLGIYGIWSMARRDVAELLRRPA